MAAQIITFNCILKNKTGRLISSTFNRDVINSIQGSDSILDGLARGLQKLSKGEKRTILLSAEEAYGLYDPKKVILFPKSKLPKQIRIGEILSIASKSGVIRSFQVLQIHGDLVSLDGNHPLAGQDLIFEIEALAVRDATIEEIESSSNAISRQLLH